jgi:hypothetical protein
MQNHRSRSDAAPFMARALTELVALALASLALLACGSDSGGQNATPAVVDASVSCSAAQTACSGACVDLASDPTHCGQCATKCAAGQVCSSGTCQQYCRPGLVNCGNRCVDPASDRAFCGATSGCGLEAGSPGTVCAQGQVCSSGTCQVSCQQGLVKCDGTCVDPASDRSFCGASQSCDADAGTRGTACAQGQVCSSGTCQVSCQQGLVKCDGTCVDPNSDRAFCGAAQSCDADAGTRGTACAQGQVCSSGTCQVSCQQDLVNCGGKCIDPVSDRAFCGATSGCGLEAGSPGTVCAQGQVCSGGTCQVSCQQGLVNCGGKCIDPKTDRSFCGASGSCDGDAGTRGTACALGQVCSSGTCQVSCQQGLVKCDGKCVDPQTDRSFCGASASCDADAGARGTACGLGQVCSSGTCQVSCQQGLVKCDGRCVDPQTDRSFCGASASCDGDAGTRGTACGLGRVCSSGTCQLSCQNSLVNCDGTCVDPQTDRSFCGASASCDGDAGTRGTACGLGQVCSSGTCQLSCQNGLVNCDGKCIDPQIDPLHCGASGACDGDAGTRGQICSDGHVCSAGSCTTECVANQTLCTPDGGPAYCTVLTDDPKNCGSCGLACSPNVGCLNGVCMPFAPAGSGTGADPFRMSPIPASCQAYATVFGPAARDGVYTTHPAAADINVYCDMTNGAWTYESFGFGQFNVAYADWAIVGGPDFTGSAQFRAAFEYLFARSGLINIAPGWNSGNCCFINSNGTDFYAFGGFQYMYPANGTNQAVNCSETYNDPFFYIYDAEDGPVMTSFTQAELQSVAYSDGCSVSDNPAVFVKRYQ